MKTATERCGFWNPSQKKNVKAIVFFYYFNTITIDYYFFSLKPLRQRKKVLSLQKKQNSHGKHIKRIHLQAMGRAGL